MGTSLVEMWNLGILGDHEYDHILNQGPRRVLRQVKAWGPSPTTLP